LVSAKAVKAASVGVRNPSLAAAGFAFNGIDFVARLYRLHHHREARSIAGFAHMLFDLWRHGEHGEPFRPSRLQRTSVGIWRVQEKHSYVLASFDLDQWPVWFLPTIASMKPREEQFPDKDESATPKSSRLKEALQIIEEYAEGLRQIIKKLRCHLN
jgi:hypothetical protein